MASPRILEAIINMSGNLDPSVQRSIDGVTRSLDGINVKAVAVGAAVVGIGAAVGVGVAKATGYLKDLGTGYQKTLNTMQAKTGATTEEMAGLSESIQDIYKNNFGESLDDVAQSISITAQVTGLSGDELETITEDAITLCDTFEYDIPTSTRAAKAMIQSFGTDSEEAMSLIAAGAQNGLDYSGELLDNIKEYSVQFAKVGFDANDMFNIFQAGADSGAWNLDKVGDAVKEFSIRSIDGSKGSIAAYEALGLNASNMMNIFANGGEDATAAFNQVINMLMDMDDKVQRDATGVALFGTQWEDLGTVTMQALADIEGGTYDATDALKGIKEIKYNDMTAAFESIKRTLEVALLPAATNVANALMNIAPKVGAMVETATPYIISLADTIAPLITTTYDFAVNGIGFLADNMDWLLPILGGLTASLGAYKVAQLVSTVAAAAAATGITAQTVATGIWTVASGIATATTTALGAAFAFLTSPIGIVILAIGAVVAAGIALYRNWDTVKAFALGLWTSLTEVFTGIKNTIGGLLDGIKEHFVTVFSSLAGIVKTPINAMVSIINAAIDGVNAIGFDIPDWVPVVGGKKFKLNIPKMPLLAAGGFTEGVSIAGEAGTEAVLSFDPRYRKENLSYWARAGQMLGAIPENASYGLIGGGDSNTTTIDFGGVSFSPNITVNGNAEKADVMAALEEAYPEFIDMLERWFFDRGRIAYDN